MTASLPDQDKLSRIEAAAYLTTMGHDVKPSTLAKYAQGENGPKFAREEGARRVFYLKGDLNQWAHDHPPTLKNGRPKASVRNGKEKAAAPMRGTVDGSRLSSELVSMLRLHVVLADRFAGGTANASDGYRFAQSLTELRKMVS